MRRIFRPLLALGAALGLAAVPAFAEDVASLKPLYRRPASIPFPKEAPYSPRVATLCKMLFFDPRLSGAALDRIFAQVSEIDRVVGNIANGAAEQSSGLQSVNNGVSQIDRANQSNVAIVDRTTAACSSAAQQAERLAQAVARFQVERETAMRRAA